MMAIIFTNIFILSRFLFSFAIREMRNASLEKLFRTNPPKKITDRIPKKIDAVC